MADVQRIASRVEADIEGDLLLVQQLAHRIRIRRLVDEATLDKDIPCIHFSDSDLR